MSNSPAGISLLLGVPFSLPDMVWAVPNCLGPTEVLLPVSLLYSSLINPVPNDPEIIPCKPYRTIDPINDAEAVVKNIELIISQLSNIFIKASKLLLSLSLYS
jgi:hypothetical protein